MEWSLSFKDSSDSPKRNTWHVGGGDNVFISCCGTCLSHAFHKLGSGDICHSRECARRRQRHVDIFGEESTNTKSQKNLPGRGEGKKRNCFSTALFKNENQSAGSRSHSQPHRDVMNINISVYKCIFLLKSNALSESFSFFSTQTSSNLTTCASLSAAH